VLEPMSKLYVIFEPPQSGNNESLQDLCAPT
jgi:hypothetical protein